MKLAKLSSGPAVLNLRVGARLPEEVGNYGKGRGGRPWRRTRDAVMQRDGFQCQPCKRSHKVTLAAEVDHIIPCFEGGSDAMSNLEAICTQCHQAKTHAESQRSKRTRT